MRNLRFVSPSYTTIFIKGFVPILILLGMLTVLKPEASAVPSYSRQTGLPCATCHYAPPELTPFGRKFKLEGYTFTTKPTVSDDKKEHNAGLQPLSGGPAMTNPIASAAFWIYDSRNIRLSCLRESSTSQIVTRPLSTTTIWRCPGGFHEIAF
jgi:hypothetical protein